MNSHQVKKWATGLALVGLFMFSGVVLFQLQIAFGFNNPGANPPAGSGGITAAANGNIGINTTAPTTAKLAITSATLPSIDVDPSGAAGGSIIGLTATPTANDEAASVAYVNGRVGAAGGGSGAGSVVLYYKTLNGTAVGGIPQCPTGWTFKHDDWYGPHYLGMLAYDWSYNGTAGGFGGGGGAYGNPNQAGPPPNPPTPGTGSGDPLLSGYSYDVNAVAFGSDSVCSQSQQTAVQVNQFYQNQFTPNGTTFYANACSISADPNPPHSLITECNMCVVCAKE